MKKIALLLVVGASMMMVSCSGLGGKDSKADNESLAIALEQRNAELDEMLSIFNDISEGFHQINAAGHRVDLHRGSVIEGSKTAREQVAEDIAFIHKQMAENQAKIAELQEKLKIRYSSNAPTVPVELQNIIRYISYKFRQDVCLMFLQKAVLFMLKISC